MLLVLNQANEKRQKIDDPTHILKHLQENDSTGRFSMNTLMDKIKSEPRVQHLNGTNNAPEYHYNPQSNNPNMSGNSPQPQMWNNPSTSSSPQQPMWNIPSTSAVPNAIAPTDNFILDLDSRELNINSDEIVETLKTIAPSPLPEIGNLSFSDVAPNQDHNMTDSLTRLANNTIDSLCQLNNMYPSQQ
ncbi:hypothetical protein NQ314_005338 [Rhamnusium bicolor]|uniref:Uncharacterized protein n=1 Tax=Rhamnusium bicolor TaxID=1586634 RepID=A0AAV8ZH92_9CUCU|nr:hypothetical protein NQ314_005338 [Rhamnusium bicolor]